MYQTRHTQAEAERMGLIVDVGRSPVGISPDGADSVRSVPVFTDLEASLLAATQSAFRLLDDYTFTLAKAGAKVDAVKSDLHAAMTLANGSGSSN